jgi:hypothetical protein
MLTGRGHLRIALEIHIVQQPDRPPQIGITAAQMRKVTHRRGNGITVLPQLFPLHPLVQDR